MVRFQLNALLLGAAATIHQWTGVVADAGAAGGEQHTLLRQEILDKRKLAIKSTKAPVPTGSPTVPPTKAPKTTKAPKSTKAPTQSPTMYYCSEGHIMSVLATVSNPVDLETVGSPQYLAAQWILEDNICPDADNFQQRYAYVVGIYASEPDPSWVESFETDGITWLDHETHECTWVYNACDENDKIDVVDFWNKQLSGTIPPEIGLLTATTWLDFSVNTDLHGTLPSELASLTLLERADFYYNDNGFLGTLPGELLAAWAGSLTRLDVYGAGMTGTIPTEIGLCTNIVDLFLGNNTFSGGVPTELGLLTALEYLWIHNSPLLTGAIPLGFCDTVHELFRDCALTCPCESRCSYCYN
eukprot:Nitzschia sp. Nitz4//scaffold140_size61219//22690//23858//NITZ4_006438-RA/size61219-augustus-gene-0.62-mRNA-1//-1//CDS//3329536221//1516//frame0